MPIPPNAIDQVSAVAIMIAPAKPLPAGPYREKSNRPQTGEANSPRIQALYRSASARIRGPIGSTATVGPNAASIGAGGILSTAVGHARRAQAAAHEAIGSRVDVQA